MKYLVDNQLPAALARALVTAGYDAVHVRDLSLEQAPDLTIWIQAIAQHRIVISKDEDFFHLANRPNDAGRLLWLRIGNTRRGELFNSFMPRMADIDNLFAQGQRIVEVRP